jgi:hypothetical protein
MWPLNVFLILVAHLGFGVFWSIAPRLILLIIFSGRDLNAVF